MFWLFLFFRGVVGIGEASYAVISPSIIADMFTGTNRSRMLMLFYFAIPCGRLRSSYDRFFVYSNEKICFYLFSGLGFVVGSTIAALTGDWRWGVRITAILGVLCLALMVVCIEEPERGAAEREKGVLHIEMVRSKYIDDLKKLLLNATYMISTAGYTSIVFVVGTLTWWAPTAIQHNYAYRNGINSTDQLNPETKAHVNLIFGTVTCVGGIAGVAIGSILSEWLHNGVGPFRYVRTIRSDAIICGVGALIGVPTLYFSLHEIPKSMTVAWVLMFVCITSMCFNWATNVDMLMDVVIPNRRSTANSWQILISHLFGDASGPYILGMISDAIRGDDESPYGHFNSLILSFYLPNVLLVLSSILFFIAAYTFLRDHKIFKNEMASVIVIKALESESPLLFTNGVSRSYSSATAEYSDRHLQKASTSTLSNGNGVDNNAFAYPINSTTKPNYPPKSYGLFYESTKM
ncbi:hypothetical protein DICVIV_00202 [Dictyocaulus viviparus]|uniref:Major facilitator superfamily (MFS) profile domain-containing protein n=1 Tax=Dictyocaulus viviparus TaxID=29172 RepID=A0A0D8YAC8_DICVI|nr:hypothetical protein DICVIV_00202 [Dictyocaulus viviparus]